MCVCVYTVIILGPIVHTKPMRLNFLFLLFGSGNIRWLTTRNRDPTAKKMHDFQSL